MMNKTRRNLTIGMAATATSILMPSQTFANILGANRERKIALRNVHTGEDAEIVYWRNNTYQEREILKINELLRDHRSEQVTSMDVNVVDQIFAMQRKLGSDEQVSVFSAFRSNASNEELRQRSRGVAKHSYHTLGRAIDIRIPDCSLRKQRSVAVRLSAGGVGYYRRSRFIHIDSGPVRNW